MSEQINASAFGAAGLGLPGIMWALDQLKVDIPKPIVVLVLVISVGCIVASLVLWGHIALSRFGFGIPWSGWSRRIPLHIAARRAYEAMEKAGALNLVTSDSVPTEKKLNHFKLLFMIDPETDVFGIKPPSTKSRLIPKEELTNGHELYPADGEVADFAAQCRTNLCRCNRQT